MAWSLELAGRMISTTQRVCLKTVGRARLQRIDRALAERILQDGGQRLEDLRRVEPARALVLALLQGHVLGLLLGLLEQLLLLHLVRYRVCCERVGLCS